MIGLIFVTNIMAYLIFLFLFPHKYVAFTMLQELQSHLYDKNEYEGLPFDFHGGYVGYIG